jgi:hypothetical protein
MREAAGDDSFAKHEDAGDDSFAKFDDAVFAKAVTSYHDNQVFGDTPLDEAALRKTAHRWREVYEAAAGLIALRNLADREVDRLRRDGLHRHDKSGLRQARSDCSMRSPQESTIRFTILSKVFNRRRFDRSGQGPTSSKKWIWTILSASFEH